MRRYRNFLELVRSFEGDSSPAFIFGDDKKCLTRGQLAEEIYREEASIRALGPGNEFIVTDHAPGTIVRIIAAVMAGCDIVLADEGMTDENLMDLVRLARPDRIFATDEELRDLLTRTARDADRSPAEAADAESEPAEETAEGAATSLSEAPAKAEAPVKAAGTDALVHASAGLYQLPISEPGEEGRLIFFTSGTTARSRAVVLTSRSLLASSWSGQSMLPCGPGDIILCLLPLSHVFGFVCSLLWGLTYGAAVALGRGARHMLDDCVHFKPTILPAVPSVAQFLMMRGALNSELRVVLVGAAPLHESAVRMMRQMGIRVYLGYGLTETSSGIAITQDLDNPFDLYPCPEADIRIEPDGEISVSTPCLMEGYLDFGPDGGLKPVENGRFYTGDLALMDRQGALHLTGRKKDILVLPDGGKIFCPEYEAELADLLGTSDLALILKNNRPVLAIGGTPQAAANRLFALIESFNRTKPLAGHITDILIMETPLPRTATGKIKHWEITDARR